MISRRKVISILSSLPFGGLLLGALAGTNSAKSMPATNLSQSKKVLGKSIYDKIGVRPLINARGTVTVVGATRVLPEVQVAMDEAVKDFVQIDELMNGVGLRLAEITGRNGAW